MTIFISVAIIFLLNKRRKTKGILFSIAAYFFLGFFLCASIILADPKSYSANIVNTLIKYGLPYISIIIFALPIVYYGKPILWLVLQWYAASLLFFFALFIIDKDLSYYWGYVSAGQNGLLALNIVVGFIGLSRGMKKSVTVSWGLSLLCIFQYSLLQGLSYFSQKGSISIDIFNIIIVFYIFLVLSPIISATFQLYLNRDIKKG